LPRQVLFAHAAVADPRHGRLRHAERSAQGLAWRRRRKVSPMCADDWSLRQVGKGRYRTVVKGEDFAPSFDLTRGMAPLLQGEGIQPQRP
jgi:predicted secreted hydrolase